MLFFSDPFGWPFGFIFPLIFFFIGIRILRHLFSGRSHHRFDDYHHYRDAIPETRYITRPPVAPSESFEKKIFKLPNELKGRLTVSDIVIGTEFGLKEAERRIEEMVDGVNVTIDVTDSGRVVYEFPDIIDKHKGA